MFTFYQHEGIKCRLATKDLKIEIYNTNNIANCESWYFTLREKSRLRVFQNRILRRIFGLKRDATGELNSQYRYSNVVRAIKSRRIRQAGYIARMNENIRAFKILTGQSTGKTPLRRSIRDGFKKNRCQFHQLYCLGTRYELLESSCECGILSLDLITIIIINNNKTAADSQLTNF